MQRDNQSSILSTISKSHIFTTPENYFELSKDQIISQVFLSDFSKHSSQLLEVPTGYFDLMKDQILAQVKLHDLVGAAEAHTLSQSYFEKSKNQILNRIDDAGKVKSIRFNLVRFAAAACILLASSVAIYFSVLESQKVSEQLSSIKAEEIEEYLINNSDPSDMQMIIGTVDGESVFSVNKVAIPDQQLNDYINSTL